MPGAVDFVHGIHVLVCCILLGVHHQHHALRKGGVPMLSIFDNVAVNMVFDSKWCSMVL